MSEPVMPPVNAKVIARFGLGMAALVLLVIITLTFGPFRDRDASELASAAIGPVQQGRGQDHGPDPGQGPVAREGGDDAALALGQAAEAARPAAAARPEYTRGDAPLQSPAREGAAEVPAEDPSSRHETAGHETAGQDTAGHGAAGHGAAGGERAAGDGGPPAFDIVRVEPDGASVIAGRASPNASIELLARDGTGAVAVLQKGETDASGLFAFTIGPLPRGRHELLLRSTGAAGPARQSRQAVTVEIDGQRPPLVAVIEPDRPTVLLSRPDGAPPPAVPGRGAAAQPADAGARVLQVERDDAGKLYVIGRARPGATLRLYLNETLLASGVAGDDGIVEFSMGSTLPDGAYRVRLDEVDPASGKVLSRAEAPWDQALDQTGAAGQGRDRGRQPRAGATAAAGSLAGGGEPSGPTREGAPGAAPAKRASGDVVKTAPVRTHVVRRGDSLWSISRRTYRLGSRYATIYEANQDQIADRDLIYPGQVFVLPMPVGALQEQPAPAPGPGRKERVVAPDGGAGG